MCDGTCRKVIGATVCTGRRAIQSLSVVGKNPRTFALYNAYATPTQMTRAWITICGNRVTTENGCALKIGRNASRVASKLRSCMSKTVTVVTSENVFNRSPVM